MNYRTPLYLSILITILASILVWNQSKSVQTRAKNNIEVFNQAERNGRIAKLTYSISGIYLKVEEEPTEFNFTASTSLEKPDLTFREVATVGDTIIKKVNSEHILLNHEGESYTFFLLSVD